MEWEELQNPIYIKRNKITDLVPPFSNLALLHMLIISNLCNKDENHFIEHIGTCCGVIYSENEQD